MSFRLKMKVWTDPQGREFLVPMGVANLASERITAFIMRDDETKQISLSFAEYNELPYYYFEKKEPAEKPEKTWPHGG